MKISQLFYYPIKSCQGISVDSLDVVDEGPKLDRNWVLVNSSGKFLSQRQHPELSQVKVSLNKGHLTFGTDQQGFVKLPVYSTEQNIDTSISFDLWGDSCFGYEVSKDASQWFAEYLNTECYFLSAAQKFKRQSSQKREVSANLVYADGYPFLMVSEESLLLLNSKLPEESQLTIKNFRPNIVVSGARAHEEDEVGSFNFSKIQFQAVKNCPRCVVINVVPQTGDVKPIILKTLAQYRKAEEGVVFGQNLVHLNTGTLKIGDEIKKH